jgi:integrase
MPKPRAAHLESATARRRLAVAKKPYWIKLAPGVALGYRRNQGAGTWSVRAYEQGSEWVRRIGLADDLEPAAPPLVLTFWQAQTEGRKLARRQGDDDGRPLSLGEALTRYADDLRSRGGSTYNASVPRRHLPQALLGKPAALLSSIELQRWRDSLGDKLRAASINRVMKSLAAALNLAAKHDARIAANRRAWQLGLAAIHGAVVARNIILGDNAVLGLVAAAYGQDRGLGLLLHTLSESGARPSQAARLTVADLVDDDGRPRLRMPRSGKGGGRINRAERMMQRVPVPITAALARELRQAAGNRHPDEPLLLQGDDRPWGERPSEHYREPFAALVADLGLDPATTAYSLRHSSITRQLLRNVPVRIVAASHDTSVGQIEAHYSRYISEHSDELSRRALLQPEPPPQGKVIRLGA